MADYRVEGTSLVSWSILVAAGSEGEASDAAVRIAGRLSDLRRDHALRDVDHQVAHARRLVNKPAFDRLDHRSAERTGTE